MKAKRNEDWVRLEGALRHEDLEALVPRGHIEKLSITKAPFLTQHAAKWFELLPGATWLWLWCDVARPAMKHVMAIPGLKTLDVLCIKGPGKLAGFAQATSLEQFRCNHYLTAADLTAIAQSQSLRELGVQRCAISPALLDRLLDLPRLESLDLEGTKFDDGMAKQASRSKRLLSLDVGATRLTGKGLSYLSKMPQLQSLDLWATRIRQEDIDLLRALPALEYLSVGHFADTAHALDARWLIDQLAAIPSLKRVWLDGVSLGAEQRKILEQRYALRA